MQDVVRDRVDLAGLLEEVIRQARHLEESRQIVLDAPGVFLQIWRDGLKQVLLVLLDNALKYSSGIIEVTALAIEDRHKSGAGSGAGRR